MAEEVMMRRRHPLNDFAERWKLDGDLIRCRDCGRGQHVSRALDDFLAGMITAQIARAKPTAA